MLPIVRSKSGKRSILKFEVLNIVIMVVSVSYEVFLDIYC
jgi:hypothetical protein